MTATATPPAMKPQTLQVLNDLRAAGPAGVHSFHFHARFIADPAKRVCELIALGYVIDRKPERLTHDGARGTRYTLIAAPESSQSSGLAGRGDASAAASPGRSASIKKDRATPAPTPLPIGVVPVRAHLRRVHELPEQASLFDLNAA